MKRLIQAAGYLAFAAVATQAAAQQTVTMGSVGSSSANSWATYVAIEKGFFAEAGIKPDVVHAQSNAAVVQQLAAGSLHMTNNSGLVDPIRAAEKGAAVAILMLGESVSMTFLLAATLMALGVWIHLMENHVHEHQHEALDHSHRHTHDEHHQHEHDFEWDGTEPHSHPHVHVPLRHSHAHFPDVHHRHRH